MKNSKYTSNSFRLKLIQSKIFIKIFIFISFSFSLGGTCFANNTTKLEVVFNNNNTHLIDEDLTNNINKYITSNYKPNNINESLSEYAESVKEEAEVILNTYGYYNPVITTKLKKNTVQLFITTNKPVIIKSIEIACQPQLTCYSEKEVNLAIKKYQLEINKPLNHITYEKAKEDILQNSRNAGYLDATFTTHDIVVDTDNKSVQINLILNLNKKYYISDINVINQSKNNVFNKSDITNFVLSFLPKLENNQRLAYKTSEILDLQNSLSKYFSDVSIQPHINKNHTVNLLINVKPLKNYLYDIGLGYGTDEGARIFGGLQIRNITPHGHKLDIHTKFAQYRELTEISYKLPGLIPASDTISLSYQFRLDHKRSNHNIQKERQQILSEYQRTLNKGNLQYTGGLSYRKERYKDIANQRSRNSQLLVPYFNYDHIVTSDILVNNQNHRINIMLEAADRDIMSSTSFVKFVGKLKNVTPVGIFQQAPGTQLITRGQFGQVWHQEDKKLPPTLRFFAGGSESVRGYRYESLGPTQLNEKGKKIVIGGDRIVTFSAELEQPLYRKWSGAVFYDVGNAYNDWELWKKRLRSGTGAGIRWNSPLGKVRVDIARALDTKNKPWRFDFNIGPDL